MGRVQNLTFRRRKIVAKLVGGLGNQIFIYFAALDLARKNQRQLVLDFSFIERAHSSGQSRLDDFILDGEIVDSTLIVRKLKEFRERIRDSVSARGMTGFTRNYVDEKSLNKTEKYAHLSSLYLRGFHNTTRHYQAVGSPGLRLKTITDKFNQLRVEINDSLALHLRGGDYASHKDIFGPLSPSYYLNILATDNYLSAIAKSRGIYIFSDDKYRSEILKNLLQSEGFKVIEISFSYDLSPAEELLLMSNAKVLIMANSTFSFWASELSPQDTMIISPSNYTRSGGEVDFESSRNRIFKPSEWEQ